MKSYEQRVYEAERELVALVYSKKEAINYLKVKPSYLFNKNLSQYLEDAIKCHEQYDCIMPLTIYERIDNKIDMDDLIDIITETLVMERTWQDQLDQVQQIVIDHYKENITNNLYKDLQENKMSYQEYQERNKKLSEIKIDTKGAIKQFSEDDILKSEEKTFVKSEVLELDRLVHGFALGELSVWSGSNASAKSTFLNQMALESINQGYTTAIYSGELTERRLANWLVLQAAGKENVQLSKQYGNYYVEASKKLTIFNWLKDKIYIYDNDYGNSSESVLKSIEDAIKQHNIKVVIIDNLMSIDIGSNDDNKYAQQSKFITKLSSIAKEYNVHIHFVCHPRKTTTFLRKNDISGSADLTNIADNVFILHRVNKDFKKNIQELYGKGAPDIYQDYTNILEVCKNREYGIEDKFIGMYFEPTSKRLLNIKDEVRNYGWINQ